MAKVPLRVYTREIESLIEGGQIDEAVAHCQHILKTFSMYIEAYRLLGKAFLESRRYADAADIFQRALMVVPDDFVSHVGMSIIRDDEAKLDDAIWHMERAFEVQPSNPAIQGELRRLYGRRDGVEPPKIRLSRDALANMYSQGELFNQAIAEIRAVLAEDPNRPDLQVMLARAYYRAGNKVEAAEMAAALLKKYPYCMDALRILTEVLPGTARADNTQVYRQRLRLLDPYSSFVTGSVFTSEQVADNAVTLERLEYVVGGEAASPQSGWASSLGIKLEDSASRQDQPDWLAGNRAPEGGGAGAPGPESAPAEGAESLPDWMRSAGWQESSGAAEEPPADLGGEAPAEPLVEAEIPDWLKSMAPPGAVEVGPAQVETPAAESGDVPDWLGSLASAGAAEPAPAETPAAEEESAPDWLKDMAPAGAAEPAPAEAPAAEDEATPDWLKTIASEDTAESAPAEAPEAEDGSTPEWLKTIASGDAAESTPAEAPAAEEESAPDWLKTITSGDAAESTPAEAPEAEDGSTPDWLKTIASGGAAESTPAEALEAEDGSTPDWLGAPASPDPSAPAQAGTVEGEGTPEWLAGPGAAEDVEEDDQPVTGELSLGEVPSPDPGLAERQEESSAPAAPLSEDEPFQPTGEVKPLGIEDDAMAWLESLAAKQGAKAEELLTKPEERSGQMPDWLQPENQQPAAGEDPEPVAPPAAPEALPSVGAQVVSPPEMEPEPTEETPPVAEAADRPAGEEDAGLSWLNDLDAGQPEQAQAAVPAADDASGASPDWLQDLVGEGTGGETPAETAGETTPAPASSDDEDVTVTGWLKKLALSEAQEETPAEPALDAAPAAPAGADEGLPDWLQDIEKPAAAEEPPAAGEAGAPDWLRGAVESGEQAAPVQPPAVEEPPAAGETGVPDWLKDIEKPAAVEEPPAEAATWVDANVPVDESLSPTAPEEWLPVEKTAPPAETVAEVPPDPIAAEPLSTAALSQIPAQDKDGEILAGAQAALEEKRLAEAMKEYAKLIKRGRLTEEVIHDLRHAIYRFPVDVVVWQTLGDAYMRANRLQDALDAYNKAEELLR